MNQNDFILLNAGVVTLVVIFLLIVRRKPPQPVVLRLHDRDSKTPAPVGTVPPKAPPRPPPQPPGAKRNAERALNITFTFDGRMHDAFEVLQIPAGSSPQAALIAFNTLAQVTASEKMPLLQAAFAAIQKS